MSHIDTPNVASPNEVPIRLSISGSILTDQHLICNKISLNGASKDEISNPKHEVFLDYFFTATEFIDKIKNRDYCKVSGNPYTIIFIVYETDSSFLPEAREILESNDTNGTLEKISKVQDYFELSVIFYKPMPNTQKEKISALAVIMQRDTSALDHFSECDITRLMLDIAKLALPIIERAEKSIKIAGAPIPLEAPEKWTDRPARRGENPAEFIQRVYGKWLGKGLTRGDIQRADSLLLAALETWKQRHELPFDLPKSDQLEARTHGNSALVPPSESAIAQRTPRPLPPMAPEKWSMRPRPRDESPPKFVERVYAEWLDQGLTKADILNLDRPLYMALAKWSQRHGSTDLFLSAQSDITDRLSMSASPKISGQPKEPSLSAPKA